MCLKGSGLVKSIKQIKYFKHYFHILALVDILPDVVWGQVLC